MATGLDRVISASALSLATNFGADSALIILLTDKTWREAKDIIDETVAIYGVSVGLNGGEVTNYNIVGKNIQTSFNNLLLLQDFIAKACRRLSQTGGMQIIPIELGE
jgi:hypothetical protein